MIETNFCSPSVKHCTFEHSLRHWTAVEDALYIAIEYTPTTLRALAARECLPSATHYPPVVPPSHYAFSLSCLRLMQEGSVRYQERRRQPRPCEAQSVFELSQYQLSEVVVAILASALTVAAEPPVSVPLRIPQRRSLGG